MAHAVLADGEHAHCPKCDRRRRFKRYETRKRRQSWTCTGCGHHVHPTAGTIFHKSSTSLHLWFYAMYLMTSTRCGISAKQLERELGVTYKTAWRMFNLIRNDLMDQDDDEPLSGDVEVDETYVGGKPRNSDRLAPRELGWARDRHTGSDKATVFGAVERGGRVRAAVVPNSRAVDASSRIVREYVLPESLIYTDEWLRGSAHGGYPHRRINHTARVYVRATRTRTPSRGSSACQERDPRRPPRRLAQVASGLPERVRVALQPP